MKRSFNKTAYDKFDKSANIKLAEILQKNSNYKPLVDLGVELYKNGDAVFSNGENIVIFENETRENFDKIVQDYTTIHIPIRKKHTPADFYIVWRKCFSQFILIKRNVLLKYKTNIITVQCDHEMNQDGSYIEDFIDIQKKETQWYVIAPNYVLQKVDYD